MSSADGEYQDLIWLCLKRGEEVNTRNSAVRRRTVEYVEFTSTPLIGVRKTAWKNALREMEWFLSGSNDINALHESVRSWWEPWADEFGIIPFNYSAQLRSCGERGFDQIEYLMDGIRNHPFSRRNVITTWHTEDMANPLNPITNCHGTVIQAFVRSSPTAGAEGQNGVLDLFTYQRSVDVICGLPHNWIQYWALLQWLAHRTGKKVGKLMWTGGDIHVYEAHSELAGKIESVLPGDLPPTPDLVYTPTSGEFRADDFTLSGIYTPVLTDRAEMIV